MMEERGKLVEQNALREHAVRSGGDRLTSRLRSFVAGRSPDGSRVLLGGLGALGVGEMWFDWEPKYADYPGWDTAPVVAYRP